MIKPSAETLWARRVLAANPNNARLFAAIPIAGQDPAAAVVQAPTADAPLAQVFEFSTGTCAAEASRHGIVMRTRESGTGR